MKFLAVLAVLAMAFAAVSVSTTWSGSDATAITIEGQDAYTSTGITTDNIGEVAEGNTLTLTAADNKTLYRSMVIEYGASTSYGSTLEYFLDYEIEITNQGTTNNSVVITFTELGAAKISGQHVKVSGGSYTLVNQSSVLNNITTGNYYLLTSGMAAPFGKIQNNTAEDVVIDINGTEIQRSGATCYITKDGGALYITDCLGTGSLKTASIGSMFTIRNTSALFFDGLKLSSIVIGNYTVVTAAGGSVNFNDCDLDTSDSTGNCLVKTTSAEGSRTLRINGGSITGSNSISGWYDGESYTTEFATSKAVDLEVTTSFTSDVDGFALGIWESQDYSGLTAYASSFVVWDGVSVTDELMDYTIFDGTATITDTPTGVCSYTITVYNGSVTYDGITYTGSTDDLTAPSFVLTIAQGEDETEPTVKYHVSGADYGITITKNSLSTGRIGTTIANGETTNYIAVDSGTLTVSGEESLEETAYNLQIVDGKIATGDGQELTSSETGTATEPALTMDASVTGETFTFDYSTMDGKMTVSLGRNETEETYLNPATLTADAQGGALVIEGDGEGNFETSILRGTLTLGGTYENALALTLYPGAAIIVNDIPYRNSSDENIEMSITYSDDAWQTPELNSGSMVIEMIDVSGTEAGVQIPPEQEEYITVNTKLVEGSTDEYEKFSYSYTLVAATETVESHIEDITILEGDVTLTLNLSAGTEFTIAKGVSAVIGDILYYANEDTIFETTETGCIIKDGDVTLTLDVVEQTSDEVTYDGITYSVGDGDEAYLNINAVYTPAGDDTEESYDYSATVVSGVIKAVGISDITEDDTVTISILGGELWNGNYTYSTLLGVKLTFAADDSLTVTDGTLIFESIVPGTTTVVVSKDAYIGAGEDMRMAVVDSIVTITSTFVGSDMTYSMDIASGKMISTLDEGDVLSIRGLTFTVQKDSTTIQTEIDEGKTIITIKGDVDVAGIYTSDVTINMTGDLGITGTLTIQNGTWTNDVTITYVDENSKIIVKQGAAVSAKITCIKGITTAYATVSNLTAGTYTVEDVTYNEIQIYPGSVVITGPIASNDVITATNGTVVLDGVIIPAGTTLTVAKGASVVLGGEDDVTILDGGNLIIEGTASGEVVNEGTLTYGKEADVSELDVDGSGTIVDNRKIVMEDQEVSGDATKSHVYPANQRIIVRGSWTILKGADVTIKGELVIPEGTKLTVENGASLTISKANAEIYGTLVVDAGSNNVDDGAFTCYIGNVDIHGTVQSNGSFIVIGSSAQGGKVTLYEDAVFTVGADGGLAVTSEGNVTIKSGATLTIKGESAAETIYNYGTIVFDTLAPATGDSTIYQMANGAVVDIKNYTIGYAEEQATLTVTDSRLQFYVDKTTYGKGHYVYYITEDASYITDTDQTVNTIRDANALVISSETVHEDFGSTISGLKIVEKVTSVESDDSTAKHYANGRIWTNTMDLSGDVKKSSAYVGTGSSSTTHTYKYYLDLDAKTASSVSETLKIASGISLTNGKTATSYMTVTGEFDASAWTSSVGIDNTNGVIKVKGLGIIKSRDLDGTVHAAKTEVNSTNKIYHFMTIDAMIAAVNADGSKIKEFEVVGTENYVTVTASIPKDVVMTVTGNVYIGESASDFETTLTIINGAEVKGSGTIEVYGTMYAENATNVKSSTEIISDIDVTQVDEKGKTIKDGWEKWTNIASALSGAQIGDVITVTKELDDGQYVRLYASAEVKYGVVLEIGDEAAPLWLANGVTLTVNGMFVTEQEIYAQSMFDLVAKNNAGEKAADRSSAIVVNGEIHALFTTSYAYNAQSPSTDDDNAVSMKDGAPIAGAYYSNDEYNVIAGIDTAMYDIEEIISEIIINGKVTADIVAFSATETCTKMKIGNDITNYETLFTVGTIVLDGTTLYGAGTGAITGIVVVEDSAVVLEEVTGAFSFNENDDKLIMSKTFIVPTKKHLEISEGIVYAGKDLTITGTDVSVAADAILTANESSGSIANLTVDGILSVPNNKGITVTNLTVYGAVAVAEATASASQGNLNVTDMYVGMSKSDVTSASASVSGPFAFTGYVLVHNSATLDKAALDIVDATKNTKYFVDGKLWFTAYGTKALNVKYAPISDAKLESWNSKADFTGTTVKLNDSPAIGTYEALYAKINYDIYRVEIKSDAGIKEISLNGKLMKSPASGTNVFYLNDLRAGTYKVSYTLINGYEGTATLKTSEGTILQNNSFTLSGMDDDQLSGGYYVFEYQLNGTEPVPEPEPVTPEEQSEWTITTILLCVLVVLIAIMAVIVALRLNRN